MELLTLSDISTMNGVRIRTSDILISREYTKDMLIAYPCALDAVNEFFEEHPKAKAIVIRGGLK